MKKVHVRYEGTDTALLVDYGEFQQVKERFKQAHQKRFGFVAKDLDLIVEAISVEAVGKSETIAQDICTKAGKGMTKVVAQTKIYSDGRFLESPIYDRLDLKFGHKIKGPALIIEANATTVVEPEWQAIITNRNDLLLTRFKKRAEKFAIGTAVDPVKLEIFNNLYMSIFEP